MPRPLPALGLPPFRAKRFDQRATFSAMVLSMDCISDYVEDSGAVHSHYHGFRQALRCCISRIFANGLWDARSRYDSKLLLCELRKCAAPANIQRFVWWASWVLDTPSEREFQMWNDAIRRVAPTTQDWTSLGLPPALAEALQLQYQRYNSRYPICDEALSEWDQHMYRVLEFDDDDPAVEDPDSFMHSATTNFRALRFWSTVRHLASDAEILGFQEGLLAKLQECPHDWRFSNHLPPLLPIVNAAEYSP